MYSLKRKFGNEGEDIACKFLMKQGFKIIERNYLRKWGEIDIVAEKGMFLHFIEVKSISCATGMLDRTNYGDIDNYRPEDNLHRNKLKRLSRAIQTYLADRNVSDETEWFFDVVTVCIENETRKFRVDFLENIIL